MKKRKRFLAGFLAAAVVPALFFTASCKKKPPDEPPYKEPDAPAGVSYTWIDDRAPIVQFDKPAESIVFLKCVERTMSDDIRQLISSLKAIVNRKEVRLFTADLNSSLPGWLDRLGYNSSGRVTEYSDPWEVIELFRGEFGGAVIYDTANLYTVDLACTFAGINNCLTASYSVYGELLSRGYDVKIIEDYRGRFADKYEVYNYLYGNLWGQCTHRIMISMHVDYVSFIRSFGMIIRSAFVYLNVKIKEDHELMTKFLKEMPSGEACIYGWYASEGAGVRIGSEHGVWTYAADYLENIEFFAHAAEIALPDYTETFTKREDVDDNTVYVALAASEGDNLTFDLKDMYSEFFAKSKFGTFPMTLSLSPTSAAVMPDVLNYFYARTNDNIGFMTGPSGIGYTYTNSWEENEMQGLRQYLKTTNKYCKIAGIGVVNNWTASGSWDSHDISDNIRSLMEENLTDILLVADQGARRTTARNGLLIAGMQIGYTQTFQNMNNLFKAEIVNGVAETEHYGEPSFIMLQGNPWTRKMVDDLSSLVTEIEAQYDNVKFVRMDELARAYRLYSGLSAAR